MGWSSSRSTRREVAEIGPGAIAERAALEGRIRSATLLATTRARVAKASHDQLQLDARDALARTHRREEPGTVEALVDRAGRGHPW